MRPDGKVPAGISARLRQAGAQRLFPFPGRVRGYVHIQRRIEVSSSFAVCQTAPGTVSTHWNCLSIAEIRLIAVFSHNPTEINTF